MATTAEPLPSDPTILRLNKRVRNLSVLCVAISLLSIAAIVTFTFVGWRKLKAIERTQDDVQFSQFVSFFNANTDYVQPNVNTIQFLRRGYSIDFDSVTYTQDGLVLNGVVGNATNLWISGLALDMTAQPYPYKIRDKWLQGPKLIWWSDDWNIGHAQTTVGYLSPGSTSICFSR